MTDRKHYVLITENDDTGWEAELRNVDSDRFWVGSGVSELDAIGDCLQKAMSSMGV